MTSERKEPHLSGLDPAGPQERIPTLSDRAPPDLFADWKPAAEAQTGGDDLHRKLAETLGDEADSVPNLADYDFVEELTRPDPETPEPEAPAQAAEPEPALEISAEDIEALSDRVLDQVAPALREAVTAAVTELVAARSRDPR